MFFHFISDGAGGYYAFPVDNDWDSIWAGPLALIVLLAGPLFTAFTFGEQLLLPTVLLLLGFLLLYTPGCYDGSRNTLLVYSKAALSVPLFHYGAACLAYTLAKAGNTIVGTSGFLVFFSFLIMFVPLIALVVVTRGFSALMLIGWPITYISASNGSAQTATMALLHISLLLMPVIFLIGVIIAVRNHDKPRLCLMPKLIAFAMGVVPLALADILPFLPAGLVVLMVIGLYGAMFYIYCYLFKRPAVFADWLLYPFLLSLAGYVIVHMDRAFVLPSDVFFRVYDVLKPLEALFDPALRICSAFASVLGDGLYRLASWFFRVIPEFRGTSIDPVDVPPFVGALLSVALVWVTSFFITRILERKKKA